MTDRPSMKVYQRVINRVISGGNSARYWLTEPVRLRVARWRHAPLYRDQSENPLISIIIPTYNRGRILVERTLPSILKQTYSHVEIVIVGDHCIDDTPERLAKLNDSRVRFYDLPQRGRYPHDPASRWFVQGSVPRNVGLRLARGKWLGWISDDDVLLPHHLESLLRFAQRGDYEFVSAAYIEERYGEEKIVDVQDTKPRIGGMQTWLYRSYLRFFYWNIHSWRKSWNRPVDYDLQFRMVNAGVRMGFLNEVVAYVPPVEGTQTVGLDAQRILAQSEAEAALAAQKRDRL